MTDLTADPNAGRWLSVFHKSQRFLPLPENERDHAPELGRNPVPLKLSIDRVSGIPFGAVPELPSLPEGAEVDVRFRYSLSFFHKAGYFFGRTWHSNLSEGSQQGTVGKDLGQVSPDFSEEVFFHTRIRDERCIAVFEVYAALTAANSPTEVAPGEFSLGWGLLPCFSGKARDSPVKGNVPLFEGSPRALMFGGAQDLESRLVPRAAKCRVDYTLAEHASMGAMMHLIRENEMVDDTMAIPGVARDFYFDGPDGSPTEEETLEEEDGELLVTAHPLATLYLGSDPQVVPASELLCGEFALRGATSKFEDKMLARLEQDRMREFGLVPGEQSKNSKVQILKRSVKLTLHNTHTTIAKPIGVELQESARDSDAFENMTTISVPDFVAHPGVALAMAVQYTVRYSGGSGRTGGSGERVITLGWVPFIGVHLGRDGSGVEFLEGRFSVSLINGFGKSIDGSSFTFAPELIADEDLSFEFSVFGDTFRPRDPDRESDQSYDRRSESSGELAYEEESSEGEREDELEPMAVARRAEEDSPADRMPLERARAPSADEMLEDELLAPVASVHGPQPAYPAAHLVPLIQHEGGIEGRLSRARLAELYEQGFPEVTDTNGSRPADLTFEVRKRQSTMQSVLTKERSDKAFKANEVVIQFLAYEPAPDEALPKAIFFTMQFFRFAMVATEAVHVSHSAPHVLKRVDATTRQPTDRPGFVVRYPVAEARDQEDFLEFLATKSLSLDVWDGNSLLPIGSASVDLHGLLRQQRSAVQWVDALPVLPHAESNASGPAEARPKGTLYLRVVNIGRPLDGPEGLLPAAKHLVVPAGKFGNSSHDSEVTPRILAEVDLELAEALTTRRTGPYTAEEAQQMLYENDGMFVADAGRRRRGRFAMVQGKRTAHQADLGNRVRSVGTTFAEQREMERDFKLVDLHRERRKRDVLTTHLREALCTRHTLRPSYGDIEFFEFKFTNPYGEEHYFSIMIDDDSALQVVTDAAEVRQFKRTLGLTTPTEDSLFHAKPGGAPGMFLRAGESVHIPFKYVSVFQGRQSETGKSTAADGQFRAALEGEEHPSFLSGIADQDHGTSSQRVIHLSIQNQERRAVAVVDVAVVSRPPVVDQTFHFYQAENDFLKRSVRVPPRILSGGRDEPPQCFVRCSDPSVLVGTAGSQSLADQNGLRRSDGAAIFIKVRCGPSPSASRFFIVVYADSYGTRVAAVWQVFVHSLQRIDLHGQVGQGAQTSLLVRGTDVPRLVQAFSSAPSLLRVPQTPFSLVGGSLNEISAKFVPLVAGSKQLLVNVVDVEYSTVVSSWLMHTESSPAHVTKTYELALITGQLKKKKLTYANPYSRTKKIVVRTDKPHLLRLPEPNFEIGPGETAQVGLTFLPSNGVGRIAIMIFLNDADHDKTEETILFTCTYQDR